MLISNSHASMAIILSMLESRVNAHDQRFSLSGRLYYFQTVGIIPRKSTEMLIISTVKGGAINQNGILTIAPVRHILSTLLHFPSPYLRDRSAAMSGPMT